jgi:hypothetical protein
MLIAGTTGNTHWSKLSQKTTGRYFNISGNVASKGFLWKFDGNETGHY